MPALPRLPVRRVAAAPAAVLLELHAVRRIPLGLLRPVIPPLALGAREGDCDSDSGCHLFPLVVPAHADVPRPGCSMVAACPSPASSGGWARTTDLCIMSAAL